MYVGFGLRGAGGVDGFAEGVAGGVCEVSVVFWGVLVVSRL